MTLFCIAWLRRHPDRIVTELDSDLVARYRLERISNEPFDRLLDWL